MHLQTLFIKFICLSDSILDSPLHLVIVGHKLYRKKDSLKHPSTCQVAVFAGLKFDTTSTRDYNVGIENGQTILTLCFEGRFNMTLIYL